jgi:mono/diheme cytochrome c family protein
MSYRKALSRLGVVIAAAALVGCASAEGPAAAPAPAGGGGATAATPAMVAEGATLFAGTGRCSRCHGDAGVGGRFGPSLSDDTWVHVNPANATAMTDLENLIRTGIAEPRIGTSGMPAMGGAQLTDPQIQALAAYVLSL